MHRLYQAAKFFLNSNYLKRLQKLDKLLDKHELRGIISLAQDYFPRFAQDHWHSLPQLLADFKQDYPFTICKARLPEGLLGVFVPQLHSKNVGLIVINSEKSSKMHLSTVAHENGHLFTHFYRLKAGTLRTITIKNFHPRVNELMHSLNDPEELLADYVACLGAFPRRAFEQAFCSKNLKVRWLYRKSPLALFIRAGFYILSTYPELMIHFPRTDNRTFHLCLTIHYIRLRTFLYQEYNL